VVSHLGPECEVEVNTDGSLKCCLHHERATCITQDFITTFTVVDSALGKNNCRRRFIWSEFRQRCIRLFGSGRRQRGKSDVPTSSTTVGTTSEVTTISQAIEEETVETTTVANVLEE